RAGALISLRGRVRANSQRSRQGIRVPHELEWQFSKKSTGGSRPFLGGALLVGAALPLFGGSGALVCCRRQLKRTGRLACPDYAPALWARVRAHASKAMAQLRQVHL